MLAPWVATVPEERAWLAAFGARVGAPIPDATPEELWRLYALSRVSDLVLTRWPPPADGGGHAAFLGAMGLTRVAYPRFTPFYHEIVAVLPAQDPDATAVVVDEVWPGWTLGRMLFVRAGVVVRAGSRKLDPAIAPRSLLHWTFRRPNREARDLSCGWGSNSQWRTKFRRDYHVDGWFHYNVDAADGVEPDPRFEEELPVEQQLVRDDVVELVRHRGFVRCRKTDCERWVYDAGWSEPDRG